MKNHLSPNQPAQWLSIRLEFGSLVKETKVVLGGYCVEPEDLEEGWHLLCLRIKGKTGKEGEEKGRRWDEEDELNF